MARRYAVLDVFTGIPLSGNPLAVVLDADGLDDRGMQAIAREFNLSETVFVLPPENEAHTARIRIFTPAVELPFAGHPTIGTACLLASEKFGGGATPDDAMLVLEEEAGPVRCAVALDEGLSATFDCPQLPRELHGAVDPLAVARALGLEPGEVGFENHRPSIYSAGVPFLLAPVAGLESVAKARVDRSIWLDAFPVGVAPTDVYIYCRATEEHDSDFHARMFGPIMGIDEDPATGAAAAALAGAVAVFDAPPDGPSRFSIEQGFEMGRPSSIRVDIEIADDALSAVRIGGQAVLVARGELLI